MTPRVPTRLLDALTDPLAGPAEPGKAQSLAQGAAGVALLHIERAHAGVGTWSAAHTWVRAAAAGEISGADSTGLCLGVPAICFLLHTAGADGVERYGPSLAALKAVVVRLAHRRVDAALARIGRGEMPRFAEYDLFYGLTGIGQLLLRVAPEDDALERILGYLVRLTEPLRSDGTTLPGWWTVHDPDPLVPTPGGHANFGLAHGITGPLALLSLAHRHGLVVDGQAEAITTICAHLDDWRHDGDAGSWWPYWITRDELRARRVHRAGPPRPSWCYGTPGIARARQLAALATADVTRQATAERALAACLSDPAQLALITDPGLCHGWAGLYQTAWRAAQDALTPAISARLPHLADLVRQHAHLTQHQTNLLNGAAGIALALHTAARATSPLSGWDSCLLIT